MVLIASHIFTAIFPREYLLAIKFLVGNEIPKSEKKEKNLKKKKKKKKHHQQQQDWALLTKN